MKFQSEIYMNHLEIAERLKEGSRDSLVRLDNLGASEKADLIFQLATSDYRMIIMARFSSLEAAKNFGFARQWTIAFCWNHFFLVKTKLLKRSPFNILEGTGS